MDSFIRLLLPWAHLGVTPEEHASIEERNKRTLETANKVEIIARRADSIAKAYTEAAKVAQLL